MIVEDRRVTYAALAQNGSPDLVFRMDEDRQYLSVTIPVHPRFAPAKEDKLAAYDQRVLDALAHGPLTLTDLARAMGYRGISKKLRDRVAQLVLEGRLARVPSADGRGVLIRRAKA